MSILKAAIRWLLRLIIVVIWNWVGFENLGIPRTVSADVLYVSELSGVGDVDDSIDGFFSAERAMRAEVS